jgi:hypothetical protein
LVTAYGFFLDIAGCELMPDTAEHSDEIDENFWAKAAADAAMPADDDANQSKYLAP